jgi:hypothetical protein
MAFPDLLSALKSHLDSRPQLAAVIRGPYLDEVPQGEPAPEGNVPSYVVISQTGAGEESRSTKGGFIDWYTYDFKVYHEDQDSAMLAARMLGQVLDLFNRKPRPRFTDDSYLMSWLRQPPMENKVPDSMSAGSRSLYRQALTYRARIGGVRRAMVT